MTKGMNLQKRQIISFTEVFEPWIRLTVIHRFPVPFCEKPICFYPLISAFQRMSVLLCTECPQQFHNMLRKFQCPSGFPCLCLVSIIAALACVIRCSAHCDNVILKVNVLPFQTEHFPAPKSAVYQNMHKYTISIRLWRIYANFQMDWGLVYATRVNFFVGTKVENCFRTPRILC